MPYVTLLVPIEPISEIDRRLALAIGLANLFDAKLIGVGAGISRPPLVGGGQDDGQAVAALMLAESAEVEASLQRAKVKFESAATVVRRGSSWRSAVQFPDIEVTAAARAADLIVTSQGHGHSVSNYSVAAPVALALQAGRPVLIAPADSVALPLNCVLVAWKDTREARRAVADALPILERADRVIVVEVCSHDEGPFAEARVADVVQYLLGHGVHATPLVCHQERDRDPAQQFVELAEQQGADLVVAGAHGHSRLQEWVFGGFTHALLAQTSRAVLLSH